MRKLLFVFLILFTAVSTTWAQATTVYIVRHAEKDMADGNVKDPRLTPEGLKRSFDLSTKLESEEISAIFSTNYIRTIQTAEPLSKRIKKKIQIYDPTIVSDIVRTVGNGYKGKTVLIVGHSNTILPMIRAFGGSTTITEIKDYDYSYLFKLIINETVNTSYVYYGD